MTDSPLRLVSSWIVNSEFDFFVEMAGVEQANIDELDSESMIEQGFPHTLISDLPSMTSLVRPGA